MKLGARLASAVVLLAVLLAALVAAGVVFDVLLGLATAVALYELSGLLARAGARPLSWVLYPLGLGLVYRFLLPSTVPALEWALGAAVVAGLLGSLVVGPDGILRWTAAVGAAVYLGLSLGYWIPLLRLTGPPHQGLRVVLTTLGAAMVGDTVALFVGTAAGRHRFFSRISPRKTLEGAVAGAVATVAGAVLAGTVSVGLTWYQAVVLGILVAIAAQGGDLVESALKRAAGAKDSSRLVPGHGGLLDRLDSLVLLGPVVYSYLRLLGSS